MICSGCPSLPGGPGDAPWICDHCYYKHPDPVDDPFYQSTVKSLMYFCAAILLFVSTRASSSFSMTNYSLFSRILLVSGSPSARMPPKSGRILSNYCIQWNCLLIRACPSTTNLLIQVKMLTPPQASPLLLFIGKQVTQQMWEAMHHHARKHLHLVKVRNQSQLLQLRNQVALEDQRHPISLEEFPMLFLNNPVSYL